MCDDNLNELSLDFIIAYQTERVDFISYLHVEAVGKHYIETTSLSDYEYSRVRWHRYRFQTQFPPVFVLSNGPFEQKDKSTVILELKHNTKKWFRSYLSHFELIAVFCTYKFQYAHAIMKYMIGEKVLLFFSHEKHTVKKGRNTVSFAFSSSKTQLVITKSREIAVICTSIV